LEKGGALCPAFLIDNYQILFSAKGNAKISFAAFFLKDCRDILSIKD
jgi:hypothetical protein